MYCATTGTFLQRDPVSSSGPDLLYSDDYVTQRLKSPGMNCPDVNLYEYCSSNPINRVDPFGLEDRTSGSAFGTWDGSHAVFVMQATDICGLCGTITITIEFYPQGGNIWGDQGQLDITAVGGKRGGGNTIFTENGNSANVQRVIHRMNQIIQGDFCDLVNKSLLSGQIKKRNIPVKTKGVGDLKQYCVYGTNCTTLRNTLLQSYSGHGDGFTIIDLYP